MFVQRSALVFNSLIHVSAGGQLLQPSDVKSSMTVAAVSLLLNVVVAGIDDAGCDWICTSIMATPRRAIPAKTLNRLHLLTFGFYLAGITDPSYKSGNRHHFCLRASDIRSVEQVISNSQHVCEDEVCYWRDMTLVIHLLNLLLKREIRANYCFSSAKIRAANRKEIARGLHDEIVLMR